MAFVLDFDFYSFINKGKKPALSMSVCVSLFPLVKKVLQKSWNLGVNIKI